MPQCKNCAQSFVIDDNDRAFYQTMQVPEPTWCPACRRIRRLIFNNAYVMYQDTCALTGKTILSLFNPSRGYTVYSNEAYWSDRWDPYAHGRSFDFSKPFFTQFKELYQTVPHQAFNADTGTLVNSDFCNAVGHLKDCYLVFNADFDERCLYTTYCSKCRDVVDAEGCQDCELGYHLVRCDNCYNSAFLNQCVGCADCLFCFDCTNCQYCFGCVNLKNKKYCIYGEQKTKEEYEAFVRSLSLGSRAWLKTVRAQVEAKIKNRAVRYYFGLKNEDVSGNYLYNSKDAHDSYDVRHLEHGRYCEFISLPPAKDIWDFYSWGNGIERCYDSTVCGEGAYNLKWCFQCWPACSNLEYCAECHSTDSCFGCVGLKKGQYAILNKRYDKEEYAVLKEKIINHMRETGEYGEFFPAALSPFAYNESDAGTVFHPLLKEEVVANGWLWEDNTPGTFGKETLKQTEVPDDIQDVPETFVREVLACIKCDRNYKVIKQEFTFYKKMNVPIPELCMLCRFQEHFKQTARRALFERVCAGCGFAVKTVYPPGGPERVLCESCYLKEVV